MTLRVTADTNARLIGGLVLAVGLASAPSAVAQGTIAYFRPAEPLYGLQGLQLDLNGDGQAEVRFYSASEPGAGYFGTAASGVATARLLVTPQGPFDIGSYLVGLTDRYSIGGPLPDSMLWAAADAPNGYGGAIVLGAWLPQGLGDPIMPDGHFYGTTAFAGIQFQIGSDWHNGWMRIRGGTYEDALAPPGWILDWAYETRAGVPILAGAVPEPSTWALLVGGGVLMVWFRRTRNERRG